MTTLPSPQLQPRRGKRASRLAGRIWLVVLFFVLFGMNFATGLILPLVGTLASKCMGGLAVSVVWDTMLLTAIGCKQGWARYVLVVFLFAFVVAQILFVMAVVENHPIFEDEGIQVVILLAVANVFAAIFLMVSSDIRQLSRRGADN